MKKQLIVTSVLFCSLSQAATTQDIEQEIAKSYKQADYLTTLELVNKLPKEEFKTATPYYMQGLSYYQLQQYEKANAAFAKTIRFVRHPQDSHYFYAQSLLAVGKKEEAKEQFKSSFRSDYKQPYSKYYTHYIEKDLSQHDHAREGFKQIATTENYETDIKQPAQHEYAKLLWENLKQKDSASKDDALKVYDELKFAYNMNSTSPIASDIEQDYINIDSQYKLGKETYSNGIKVPKKNTFIRFYEYLYYDSNVASLADNSANNTPTNTASMVSSSFLKGSYRFNMLRNITVQPEAELTYLKHTNTSSGLVYQNDSLIYGASLINSYKHTLAGKPSSFLFDIQYNSTQRDRNAEKTLTDWGTNTSFTVGESFKYFDWGFTQIRLKHNQFSAYTDILDNSSNGLSIMQFWNRADGSKFLFLGNYTATDSKTDSSDSSTLMLRTDYIVSDFYPSYEFTFGMGVTFTDPIEMRDQRGLEKLYNPSLRIARNFKKLLWDNDLFLSLKYNYKLNSSKDTDNYAYSKHELGVRTDLYF